MKKCQLFILVSFAANRQPLKNTKKIPIQSLLAPIVGLYTVKSVHQKKRREMGVKRQMKCPNCGKEGTIIKKYDEWDGDPYLVCISCWEEFDICPICGEPEPHEHVLGLP